MSSCLYFLCHMRMTVLFSAKSPRNEAKEYQAVVRGVGLPAVHPTLWIDSTRMHAKRTDSLSLLTVRFCASNVNVHSCFILPFCLTCDWERRLLLGVTFLPRHTYIVRFYAPHLHPRQKERRALI